MLSISITAFCQDFDINFPVLTLVIKIVRFILESSIENGKKNQNTGKVIDRKHNYSQIFRSRFSDFSTKRLQITANNTEYYLFKPFLSFIFV